MTRILPLNTFGSDCGTPVTENQERWERGWTWFDYVVSKISLTENIVTGGVIQTFTFSNSKIRYRFIAEPYVIAQDNIYKVKTGQVLSETVAVRAM